MKFDRWSWRRVWTILKKEFLQLRRDKTTLGMIVGIPIVQLMLFGYAINSEPRQMPTAVLSRDSGLYARNIVTGLKNSDYFAMTHTLASEADGRRLLQQGVVTFVITIPGNFSRDLMRGHRPHVLIEADATDPIAIAGALGAVDGVMHQVIQRDRNTLFLPTKPTSDPFEVRIHRLYNPEGLSRYNIVPGLIGIVLTMTGVMMTALSLTRERERGTLENLLAMPVTPLEVMAGKVTPYVIIGYLQSGIILLTAYYVFGVPIIGSLGLLALSLLIFIICNLALGFALSASAENQMQANQMSVFILLPSILLSGFMFPFRGMPIWAQAMGSVLPNTYFIRIVRGVMLKGSGFAEIWPHLWPLLLFMVAITAVAMKVYRRTLD